MKTLALILLLPLMALAQGMKVSQYPNLPNLRTNDLFLIASPADSADYNITYGQLLQGWSYRYTTNSFTNRSCVWGGACFTNIAAGFTLVIPPPGPPFYETAVLWVTNGFGSDFPITFPNGVIGTPGSGKPPVYYCTNGQLTRIMVEHYGLLGTNAYKLDFAQ